jgi:hypothetical protein
MKNLIFIIFAFCLIVSCEPKCTDDPNLTSDELSWLPYTNGQMLIYKSDTGSFDTAYVQTLFTTGDCVNDNNGCTHCYQIGGDRIKFNNGSEIDISVEHYNKWFPDNLNSAFMYEKFSNVTPQNNIILNGNSYNNVYIIGGVYYIKGYGVIAYTTYGVTKWVRIN